MILLEFAVRGGRGLGGRGRGGGFYPGDHPTHWLGLAIVVIVVILALYVAYGHRLRRRREGPKFYRGHGKWE